jgi:hypothetical protein
MNRLIKHLPAFLLLVFVGLGCDSVETVESNKIPQAEIKQFYKVSSSKNNTEVSAVFNHENVSVTVELNAPSKITHNGKGMPKVTANDFAGTTYELSFDKLQTNHEFVYTNGDGNVFRNSMSFEPLEIAASEIEVSRSINTIIPLSRAVGKDENVSVDLVSDTERPPIDPANSNLNDNETEPKYSFHIDGEFNSDRTAIVLKPKDLKNFVGGKALLQIEIGRESALQQANAVGGTISWRYESRIETKVVN